MAQPLWDCGWCLIFILHQQIIHIYKISHYIFLNENDISALHVVKCIYEAKPIMLIVYHCASGKLNERNALVSILSLWQNALSKGNLGERGYILAHSSRLPSIIAGSQDGRSLKKLVISNVQSGTQSSKCTLLVFSIFWRPASLVSKYSWP